MKIVENIAEPLDAFMNYFRLTFSSCRYICDTDQFSELISDKSLFHYSSVYQTFLSPRHRRNRQMMELAVFEEKKKCL